VYAALLDRQVEALEDFPAVDFGVKVFDFKQRLQLALPFDLSDILQGSASGLAPQDDGSTH
jgi:hypothetical protein